MVNFKGFELNQRDKPCSRARCTIPRVAICDVKLGVVKANYDVLQVQLPEGRANHFWEKYLSLKMIIFLIKNSL